MNESFLKVKYEDVIVYFLIFMIECMDILEIFCCIMYVYVLLFCMCYMDFKKIELLLIEVIMCIL